MVANPKKFQLMFLTKTKNIERDISVSMATIRSANTVNLF